MQMKIELKKLNHTKWTQVSIKEIQGNSVCSYMLEHPEERLIAAVFDADKPILFICNNQEDIDKYKEKGVTLPISVIEQLMGKTINLTMVESIFEGATLESVEQVEPNKQERKAYWMNGG